MKKLLFLLCAIVLLLAACQSKKQQESASKEQESEISEGIYHFDFQDFELWTLRDKSSTMSAALFSDVDPEILNKVMPKGEAESSINVFLIRKNDKYVLFDAGLGIESGGEMLSKLSSLQLTPADIDFICLTHCHRDHIGGMMNHDTAVFPNAEIWLSALELEAFQQDESVKKMLKVYDTRIHTFAMGDTLAGFIETFDAAGHTPGHTVYKVGELYIIGDLIHAWQLQIPYPEYCAVYDKDPVKAVETRKLFYQILENPDYKAAGMHLPISGVMQSFGILN